MDGIFTMNGCFYGKLVANSIYQFHRNPMDVSKETLGIFMALTLGLVTYICCFLKTQGPIHGP